MSRNNYHQEAPAVAHHDESTPVCPVSFATAREGDPQLAAVLAELTGLRPWYELGRERRGRSTVGLSACPVEQCARRLADLASGHVLPADPLATVDELRRSAKDLKAFYVEAVTAQPGSADGAAIDRWFWNDAACARLLRDVRGRCIFCDVPALFDLDDFMLVSAAWTD